jgi:predicted esterase
MTTPLARLGGWTALSAALFAAVALQSVRAQTPQAPQTPGSRVVYRIAPHETDPAITRFDLPHYVAFDAPPDPAANLLVFMSGTGGAPAGTSEFLGVAVSRGYRVISLAYNDTPAVVAICTRNPDPACSGKFRQKRIFGDDVLASIDDQPAESIVNRLAKLIAALDRAHPAEGWGQYLDGAAPKWSRIAVAGHSQGAGMAAYLAQRRTVARVILFSSPWDFYGQQQLAPWIKGTGDTPAERWFGAYHKKENTAPLIARAYQALKIPPDHVRVFSLEPSQIIGDNPYHLSMVGNGTTPRDASGAPAYTADWSFLVGMGR